MNWKIVGGVVLVVVIAARVFVPIGGSKATAACINKARFEAIGGDTKSNQTDTRLMTLAAIEIKGKAVCADFKPEYDKLLNAARSTPRYAELAEVIRKANNETKPAIAAVQPAAVTASAPSALAQYRHSEQQQNKLDSALNILVLAQGDSYNDWSSSCREVISTFEEFRDNRSFDGPQAEDNADLVMRLMNTATSVCTPAAKNICTNYKVEGELALSCAAF